jgi:uncharacterized protein (DUF433 family)
MTSVLERITTNPEQCGGRACIRGMRIRVIDILDLFAAGLSAEQILDEMPDLEAEDLQAALRYAARKLDHRCSPHDHLYLAWPHPARSAQSTQSRQDSLRFQQD